MSAWNTQDATAPKPAPFVPVRRVLRQIPSATAERIIRWDERAFQLSRENYVPVWIAVLKLDAMLPLASNMHHVRFAGENGIGDKYTGVDEFVRSHKRTLLSMPWVKIERACEKHPDQDIVYIMNGRHRFAWMRDHGAQSLPVGASVSEADEIARLVGTKDRVCRVTMWKIPEWDWRTV
jgi:hypothetical protein